MIYLATTFSVECFYLLICILLVQKEAEKPDLHNGAVKAIQDLYDVVHHDVLSVNMRFVRWGSLFLALVYYGIPLLPFYNIPCMYIFSENTMRLGVSCQKQGLKVVFFQI